MNMKLNLTKEQMQSVENLAKAIKDCNDKGVRFITEDGTTFYTLNGKHVDAIELHHEPMDIGFDYVIPRYDLFSVYIPCFYMPFNDNKIDVWVK